MKLLKRIVYSWQITMESRCQVFDYVILLVRGGVDTVINTVTQNNIFYYRTSRSPLQAFYISLEYLAWQ